MTGGAPFSRRALGLVVGICGGSLLVMMALEIFGGDLASSRSAGADAYSKSAIGHHAFAELLRRLDVTVIVSRHRSGVKAGENAVLVIAEPHVQDTDNDPVAGLVRDMYAEAWTILLVLPKRIGLPSPIAPAHLMAAELMPASVSDSLATVFLDAEVVRVHTDSVAAPLTWTGDHSRAPVLSGDIQLLRSDRLTPVISCDEGILLGEWTDVGDRLVVLSDPDLIATHGIGQNAALVVEIMDDLRDGENAVVIDAEVHGFGSTPSVFRELFDFPLILITFQLIVLLFAGFWMAMVRFGSAETEELRVESGKRYLITNTADLLRAGGHETETLTRYVRTTFRDVARRLHVPARIRDEELVGWLQSVSRGRGSRVDLQALYDRARLLASRSRADEAAVIRTASEVHRWRQEMLHES